MIRTPFVAFVLLVLVGMPRALPAAQPSSLPYSDRDPTPSTRDWLRDFPPDHWAYRSIKRLAAEGILDSVIPVPLRSDAAITRDQLSVQVARLLERAQPESVPDPDARLATTRARLEGQAQELGAADRDVATLQDQVRELHVEAQRLREQVRRRRQRWSR